MHSSSTLSVITRRTPRLYTSASVPKLLDLFSHVDIQELFHSSITKTPFTFHIHQNFESYMVEDFMSFLFLNVKENFYLKSPIISYHIFSSFFFSLNTPWKKGKRISSIYKLYFIVLGGLRVFRVENRKNDASST